jgi:signal-transduction protein with cAMP-binding, CBS, and nucleotidyltransferase domain
LVRKRKVEADEKQSIEEIKRLRQETRDLSSQFTALDVRSREIMALVQQLQENTQDAGQVRTIAECAVVSV